MAPKKAQKMSLNEFLGDTALGSWADEMDALPTAPAVRADDGAYSSDRRRDDFLSSRSDRAAGPFREDLPLPTEPPFTAFIGNLAFDITDSELEDFFSGLPTKSVKIIKDRDDKPKGFGYIEFATLDALKEALAKSGTSFAGRNIRVSVAEPPKERSGFGGRGGFDDDDTKFANNWRRDGPLPDLPDREGPRRRDGPPLTSREPLPPSISDGASDWRSSRPPARTLSATSPESDAGGPSLKRRGPGFRDIPAGAADSEEKWSIGSKFQPSAAPESSGSRFGRPRGDMGPPRDPASPQEEDTWRRPPISRNSTSPSGSTPPTPQLARRKLELLPRSGAGSASPSPLASPNPSTTAHSRSNPFGAAKPVDVTARENAITERIEKERHTVQERVQHTMSRTSSKAGSHRGTPRDSAPPSVVGSPTTPSEAKSLPPSNVRPSFSFARAAASKKDTPTEDADAEVEEVAEKLEETTV